MHLRKRSLSLILVFLMVLGLMPTGALAASGGVSETPGEVPEVVEETLAEPADEVEAADEPLAAEDIKPMASGAAPTFAEAFPDPVFRNYVRDVVLASNDEPKGDTDELSDAQLGIIRGHGEINVENMGISSLKGIEYFTGLTKLQCNDNPLGELDVSQNPNLGFLWCYFNDLKELDVSHNPELWELCCRDNQLTSLDVTHNPKLGSLGFENNQITDIDLSQNPELWDLWCNGNPLGTIDVSNNPKLKYFYCTGNELTALDVTHNPELETLDCMYNRLNEIDVTKNSKLHYLDLSSNELTSLDVTQNSNLGDLRFWGNMVTELDVSNNSSLWLLNCAENEISELDLSQNPRLLYLFCNVNNLTELDVSMLTDLRTLIVENNKLAYLNLDANTQLDLKNHTRLIGLNCSYNQLTTLDVSKSVALRSLCCENNHISYLDLSKNTELKGNYRWDSGDGVCLSPQTLTDVGSALTQNGEIWQLNMNSILDGGDAAKVTMTDGSEYDAATGIATYTARPVQISYAYDTGYTDELNHEITDCTLNVSGALLPEGMEALTFAEAFPDANFRAYVTETVLESSTESKGDSDRITAAQMSAIQGWKSVDVGENNEDGGDIKSLKGIEYFTALERLELVLCRRNIKCRIPNSPN